MTDLVGVAASKAMRRVVPLVVVCYFLAYLDRVNISFAALKMNDDLHLSPSAFGLAAGLFFISYFFFEVPSNLIMEKVGARIWIARIMITWGILSAAMALAWNDYSLYSIRFILGIAEAGFFPGVILYLTYWFPQNVRGRILGWFLVAIPLSGAIGAPLSSWVLDHLNGVGGLRGWQWLFIVEGLPTCLLGLFVWKLLDDGPAAAKWLLPDERAALLEKLAEERRLAEKVRHFTLTQALSSTRVLALAFLYFSGITSLYALNFWLPQIVKAFGGLTILQTGLLSSIPAIVGAVALLLWTRHSDVTGERNWHVALPCLIVAAALVAAGMAGGAPAATMAMLTIAAVAVYCMLATFWTLPTALLTGTAAAGGIALINSIGNLGGFVGPALMGYSKEWFESFAPGLYLLAGLIAAGSSVVLVLARRPLTAAKASESALRPRN